MKHVIAAVLLLSLLGCASNEAPVPKPRTQLEMRHLQTRTYDTDETRLVMKAVLNVLQDIGFIVETADAELGVITAEKWSDVEHTKKELEKAAKKGTVLAQSAVLLCTANVSSFGESTRVRVTFQSKMIGPAGGVLRARTVDDAGFYQRFFAQVDKGVFLQIEGL